VAVAFLAAFLAAVVLAAAPWPAGALVPAALAASASWRFSSSTMCSLSSSSESELASRPLLKSVTAERRRRRGGRRRDRDVKGLFEFGLHSPVRPQTWTKWTGLNECSKVCVCVCVCVMTSFTHSHTDGRS